MGKIKKPVKEDKKINKDRRVLKVKTTSKIRKSTRKNLGAIPTDSLKSLRKRNDVDAKLVKPVKRSSTSALVTKKSQNSKNKTVTNVKEAASKKNQGKSKKSNVVEIKKSTTRTVKKANKPASPKVKKNKVGVTLKKKSKTSKFKKNSNKKQDTGNIVSRSKTKPKAKNISPQVKKINVSLKNNKPTDVKTKKSNINKTKEHTNNTPGIKKNVSSKSKFKVNTALIFNMKHKDDSTVPNLDESTVKSAINSLLNTVENSKDDRATFGDELSIFLQFSCIKTSETPCLTLCIPLKHSLVRKTGEVCFIVQTMNSENPEEYEKTIEHYENLLKQNNITNIKKIMTYYQLRMNYAKYELQCKLVESYDVFLVDVKVHDYVLMTLRKIVYDINKLPIPVKLDSVNLKECIDSALLMTSTYLYPTIEKFGFRIGHLEMTENQLSENVFETCRYLSRKFPGGWTNITSVGIKMANSTSISIIDTLNNLSESTIPAEKSKDATVTVDATEEVVLSDSEHPERNGETEENRNCKESDEESDGFIGFALDAQGKGYEDIKTFGIKQDMVDIKK